MNRDLEKEAEELIDQRGRWSLSCDAIEAIEEELDQLQAIAGCVELGGVESIALRQFRDTRGCSIEDRYSVNCEFLFDSVRIDTRGVADGKVAERLGEALKNAARRLLEAADDIQVRHQR